MADSGFVFCSCFAFQQKENVQYCRFFFVFSSVFWGLCCAAALLFLGSFQLWALQNHLFVIFVFWDSERPLSFLNMFFFSGFSMLHHWKKLPLMLHIHCDSPTKIVKTKRDSVSKTH